MKKNSLDGARIYYECLVFLQSEENLYKIHSIYIVTQYHVYENILSGKMAKLISNVRKYFHMLYERIF